MGIEKLMKSYIKNIRPLHILLFSIGIVIFNGVLIAEWQIDVEGVVIISFVALPSLLFLLFYSIFGRSDRIHVRKVSNVGARVELFLTLILCVLFDVMIRAGEATGFEIPAADANRFFYFLILSSGFTLLFCFYLVGLRAWLWYKTKTT